MVVYIEYVILDNLIINSIIILLSVKTASIRSTRLRVILSACFGTAFAIMLPFVRLPNLILLLLKLACGLFMTFLLAEKYTVKKFFKVYCFFLLYTFVMGGACFGLIYMMGGSIKAALTLNYINELPIGVIVGVAAVGMVIVVNIAQCIIRQKTVMPFLRKVEIFYKEKSVVVDGFVDSGNMLFDPGSRLPVMVASPNCIAELMGDKKDKRDTCELERESKDLLNQMLMTLDIGLGGEGAEPESEMEYWTVAGRTKMKLYRPDKIKIYYQDKVNIIYDVMIGRSSSRLGKGEFDILIHPNLI